MRYKCGMPLFRRRTYLDFAAGALPNPSSPHAEGRGAREALESARAKLARLLEVKADDVIFTSGATEANALAILGLAKQGVHLLYLPSAHASVVENMHLAAERFGATVEPLVIRDGRVDTAALAKQLRPETVLVSMDAVCGETGVIWNTRAVATVLAAHVGCLTSHMGGGRALLHVDASHAPYATKLERAHFGADLMTLDGGKVGVRGIGALVAHRTIPLAPLYGGGGQERGLRSGTQNVEAIAAFARALEETRAARPAFIERARDARTALLDLIRAIPRLAVNEGREQAPHILNLSFPGRDTDYLVALLDEAGFAIATRSACETDSEEGSRAVMALFGDAERAKATLRVSWGPRARRAELRRFARALRQAVVFIDNDGA